ncbi:MAG: ATP-binding protein [Candidatus Aminicenantes bacterium]|nr:ATP-binding protein [Candidatus Aminicenantes bacterium]MDH5466218.1 ATP-binding protein [Candidatus Aminicenantes bacterium]MDH5704503.1 ATP-binding protein [Candidatus Aminicenantes bacterium]
MITEKKDILRLIFIRLVIVTTLVVSAFIIQFSTEAFLSLNQFYLILSFYLLSLAYLVLYLWGKFYTLQASAQIFFDLILVSALVYISGGLQGSFYFLYIFDIIAASIVISKRASYITAALSAILLGLMVELMYFKVIPYYGPGEQIEISLGLMNYNIFMAWSAFFLVAFLINYLTENLRRARNEMILAQKELDIKNKLAVAGEISAQLAHEIRNPLAAISGSVQVLKDELGLRKEQRELMDIIVDESKRVSQSIEQFLNLASIGPKVFSTINLTDILKETLTLLQSSGAMDGNLEVKGNYSLNDVRYFGNRNQFKQLFWNIIRNALKAMPGGGALTIDFNRIKRDVIQLRFADTGIGMTEEKRERIFEPFYSGFEDGQGLGMAVARKIVDDYKGKIKVVSEPDKGTEITITLPLGKA